MNRHYRQPAHNSTQTLCQPRENKRSRIEPIRPAPAAVPRGVHTPDAVRLCACLEHHGWLHLVDEVLAENLVTVTQQITRCTVPWKGLTKLLGRPLCGRMSRHAELQNARRSCASTRNTYRTWNRTVGTVKKSTDTKLRR